MNLAEALLAADAGKITKKATKEMEIPRLSKLLGEPFILQLRQISARRVREIQDSAIKMGADGRPESVDNYGLQIRLLCDGITNKDFDNRDVLKHYGAATRKDLFEILFDAGEVQDISNAISELCGFGGKAEEDKVAEVKN
jgi:hypothetical protein